MAHGQSQLGDPVVQIEALAAELPDVERVVADLVEGLAEVALTMAGTDGSCSITTGALDDPDTIASSDAQARHLDETQYSQGGGPCLTAYRTGRVVEVLEFEADHRWPHVRERALAAAVRSCLSLPLTAGDTTVGALNLYRRTPRAFPPRERQRAELAAEQIAGLVAVALRQRGQVETLRGVLRALTGEVLRERAAALTLRPSGQRSGRS